jgi:alpha-L-fucosidase
MNALLVMLVMRVVTASVDQSARDAAHWWDSVWRLRTTLERPAPYRSDAPRPVELAIDFPLLVDRLFQPDLLSGWGWKWDYRSPEQTMPDEWITMEGRAVPWEICHTLNGYWHYRRDVQITNRYGWKSKRQLISILIEAVSKGGNLLLNVSPTPRGRFDDQTMELLNGIGEWMDRHGRSIYGCTAAPEGFKAPANTLLTFNPEKNRLYVHILAWPTRLLHLGDYYFGKVEKARFLHDGSEIEFSDGQGYWDWVWTGDLEDRSKRSTLQSLTLELPIVQPGVEVPVIELFLE